MVQKCYNKPQRTQPRVFKVCDVARIAAYSVGDGADSASVVSTVGARLGYPVLIDGVVLADADELQKQLTLIVGSADLVSDLLLLIPGGIVVRLILRLVTLFSGEFAKVVAAVVLLLVKDKQLPVPVVC